MQQVDSTSEQRFWLWNGAYSWIFLQKIIPKSCISIVLFCICASPNSSFPNRTPMSEIKSCIPEILSMKKQTNTNIIYCSGFKHKSLYNFFWIKQLGLQSSQRWNLCATQAINHDLDVSFFFFPILLLLRKNKLEAIEKCVAKRTPGKSIARLYSKPVNLFFKSKRKRKLRPP